MLKKITLSAVFIILAAGSVSTAHAVEAPIRHSEPAKAGPATTSSDLSVAAANRGVTPLILTSIIKWLAANYDLPASQDLPRVEFTTPMKLVAMRYKGMMPAGWREDAIRDPSVQAAHQREVVAIYNDKTRTIFLADGWTGVEPVERSVLVHEMVHHLQNLANLKYECPAAREKLAYEAQSDWLKQQGLDLEDEFGVDLFTIFVTSACMN
jgi:hypothetical protein